MTKKTSTEITSFLGDIISFRNSLKLIHWSITGPGSYEVHISLDQAIEALSNITDRLVETSIALLGPLEIDIPTTHRPKDYIGHISDCYHYVENSRIIFNESFSQSIIDDFQEVVQQLLFRLKRLQ